MVCLLQTMHLSCVKISTISKWTEEYHRVRLKRFMSLWYVWCKPSNYFAPMLTMSQNRSKRDSTWPTSPWSSIEGLQYYFWAYGTFDANSAPILHQEQHYLKTDRTELPLEPGHLGVPSSVSKTISLPMVCLVQTMHLSCTDTNTVSKRTKTRFHTTHVTYEFHRVGPKLFMSLWFFSVQTVHLSCIKISTISKRTE
jgi:hypothetical protein